MIDLFTRASLLMRNYYVLLSLEEPDRGIRITARGGNIKIKERIAPVTLHVVSRPEK